MCLFVPCDRKGKSRSATMRSSGQRGGSAARKGRTPKEATLQNKTLPEKRSRPPGIWAFGWFLPLLNEKANPIIAISNQHIFLPFNSIFNIAIYYLYIL